MIRVALPTHLRRLARVEHEIEIALEGPATIDALLDALEERYPMLGGTIRDRATRQRRPFIRFFACGQDISLEPQDAPLPDAVVGGSEPLRVIGAMAGG
jgi:molybdopterin synthase sulfur carrier subunit